MAKKWKPECDDEFWHVPMDGYFNAYEMYREGGSYDLEDAGNYFDDIEECIVAFWRIKEYLASLKQFTPVKGSEYWCLTDELEPFQFLYNPREIRSRRYIFFKNYFRTRKECESAIPRIREILADRDREWRLVEVIREEQ